MSLGLASQREHCLDFDKVVALAREQIVGSADAGADGEHRRVVLVARQVSIVCASTALTPSVRMNVDLPDMLEPVTSTP